MKKDLQLLVLKYFLKVSALIQVSYWSFSHLFFPRWYLRSVGVTDLGICQGFTLLAMNEIGVLTLGMAVATWFCADNPVKNFVVIIMLYVVSISSILVSLYHMFLQGFAHSEMTTVIVIGVQLVILTLLFPWQGIRQRKILTARNNRNR